MLSLRERGAAGRGTSAVIRLGVSAGRAGANRCKISPAMAVGRRGATNSTRDRVLVLDVVMAGNLAPVICGGGSNLIWDLCSNLPCLAVALACIVYLVLFNQL